MGGKRLTDGEKHLIIELAPTHSMLAVSRIVNRSRQTIKYFSIANDVEFKPQHVQQEDIDLIIALKKEGLTHRVIAEKFELSLPTISKIVQKNRCKLQH